MRRMICVPGVYGAIVFAGTVQAQQAQPELSLSFAGEGIEPQSVLLEGVELAPSLTAYEYTWTSADKSWTLYCDYTLDWQPDQEATFGGTILVSNLSASPRWFSIAADAPLCPQVTAGSLLGGVCKFTLLPVGPGFATCAIPGSTTGSSFQVRIDGRTFTQMAYCPWLVATTGGQLTYITSFGTPVPSAPGPEAISQVGAAQSFMLTNLDALEIKFGMTFMAIAPDKRSLCVGDLTGDGLVDGADLGVILGGWGQSVACFSGTQTGDLNGDLVVNGVDLAVLLGAWGECPD